MFDVQSIEIPADAATVFDYVADPANLPAWTRAFTRIEGTRAIMRTPAGTADVDLQVRSSRDAGTIDWEMRFENGPVARAWSRIVPLGARSVMVFVLPAPPVPLEQLEGTLAEQSKTLTEELRTLAQHFGAAEGCRR